MGKFVQMKHEDRGPAYDIFVSSPMSAYAADERAYKENRDTLLRLFRGLKEQSGFGKFFCPALLFDDLSSFDGEHDALASDLAALEASRAFLLYYMPPLPTRPSSVFVEAGMALAARIPSVYIVRDRLDLPYMLRHADSFVANQSLKTYRRAGIRGQSFPAPQPFVKIIELNNGEAPDPMEISRWLESKLSIPAAAGLS